jgi:hypothetical protein
VPSILLYNAIAIAVAKPLVAESADAYVFISDAGICFVVVPSIIIIASESATVIDDVDLAEPSK